ncbi:MAG: recombinase family protein [Planctomycetes bacterium]|nr:recombinase family protein [Planctomycetota bacterium]
MNRPDQIDVSCKRRRPKLAPDPRLGIAYLRCSTDRQDLSPDAQRDAIRAWAGGAGVTVVAWHEDLGVSGGADLEKRPGLLAALDAVREHGAGVLVVARRDRLARDVLVAAMVDRLVARQGASIVAADGTGNGDGPEAALMRTLIDAFAQYERAVIGARTRAALAVKKARGERVGGIPYGYRDEGGVLVEEPGEQAVIARARELRAEGLSLRAVGRALLGEGHRPRRGGHWHVQVLARLVP